ncbi:MAG: HAD family hydrolase [Nannocystaceae bacterium]
MNPNPRDIIFDLDDTLIHSFESYVRLHQMIAEDVGFPIPSRETLVAYGPTWRATLERIWPDRELQPFFDRFEVIADDVPYPAVAGVPAMLTRLRGAGHRLWIVTKRSRLRLQLRMMQAALPLDCFSGIYPVEDQPHAKPDPRCFDPVWEAIGTRVPALYVGDRREDQHAAKAAGLAFVAVKTGPEATMGTFPEGLDVDGVLDDASELERWLAAGRGAGQIGGSP